MSEVGCGREGGGCGWGMGLCSQSQAIGLGEGACMCVMYMWISTGTTLIHKASGVGLTWYQLYKGPR